MDRVQRVHCSCGGGRFNDMPQLHREDCPKFFVYQLEAENAKLKEAARRAIGRIDNLNDFGDIREVLEEALEQDMEPLDFNVVQEGKQDEL